MGEPEPLTGEELQLATRNHGMPLEAMRWDYTPAGLHYVLTHYDIPMVDADGWCLEIDGEVGRHLSLSIDDLRSRRPITMPLTMECAGNGRALQSPRAISQPWLLEGVGTAEWTGTLLGPILAEAEPRPAAVEVVFTGADRGLEGGQVQQYARGLPLGDAVDGKVLLAYEMNGQELPPQHGYPLRVVVPGSYGMANVKWLRRITLTDRPYDGFQMVEAYRWRTTPDDPGTPLDRMRPRSLMVPPGIPDFLTRRRLVRGAPVEIQGRAWSGQGEVSLVEVSADGGRSWAEAALGAGLGRWAWRSWSFRWEPLREGDYVVCCRATDSTGSVQPIEGEWNLGGYANNAVQRVLVTVRHDR